MGCAQTAQSSAGKVSATCNKYRGGKLADHRGRREPSTFNRLSQKFPKTAGYIYQWLTERFGNRNLSPKANAAKPPLRGHARSLFAHFRTQHSASFVSCPTLPVCKADRNCQMSAMSPDLLDRARTMLHLHWSAVSPKRTRSNARFACAAPSRSGRKQTFAASANV